MGWRGGGGGGGGVFLGLVGCGAVWCGGGYSEVGGGYVLVWACLDTDRRIRSLKHNGVYSYANINYNNGLFLEKICSRPRLRCECGVRRFTALQGLRMISVPPLSCRYPVPSNRHEENYNLYE